MIVRSLHLEGFGVHRELRLELSPGVNVVLGPNEAGKSTIHAFVRGVLWGFPDGRSKDPAHEPVHGGPHGGSIVIESEAAGTLEIRRIGRGRRAPSLRRPDGAAVDPAELAALLRGADARLFRSVFAFGLDELASLDGLSSEEMGLRLFDAGLTGAGRSVRELVAELRREKEEALGRRSGRIRALAQRARELDRALAAARARAEGLGRLLRSEDEAAARLDALRRERAALSERVRRAQLLQELLPVERRRREARGTIEETPPRPGVSARLLERHDERLLALRRAEAERDASGARLEALEAGGEALDAPPLQALERLAEEAPLQRDRLRRLAEARAAAAGHAASLARALEALGPGWTEARVEATDAGPARRGRLAALAEALAAAELEHRHAGREHERAAAALAALDGAHEETGVPAWAELEALRGALAELRAARAEWEAARGGVPPGALAGAIACAAGAAAALAGGVPWLALALFAIAALCAAWGALEARRAAGRAAIAERMRGAALRLGLGERPSAAELEGAAARLERQTRERERSDERARQRGAAAARLEEARRQLGAAEEALARLREAWAAEAAGLDGARPAAAIELLQRLASARELRSRLVEARAEAEALERELGAWAGRASALFDAGAAASAEELVARVLAARDAGRARAEREGARLAEVERERARRREAGERRDALARELEAVLAIARAADRDELARAVEEAERRAEAERIEAEAGARLAERLGGEASAEELRLALEAPDPQGWAAGLAEARARLEALDEELGGAHEALGALRRGREELERAADVALLSADRAAVAEELDRAIARWRSAALLERVLLESLESFRRERQPEVLRRAAGWFRAVSEGRWQGLRQAADAEELEVVDAAGAALPSARLSRGAREQLYLCVRLGLATAFAARGTRLPLLMDDVLVNFDPERAEATARLLAEIGRGHQLLLFTCHPATAERLLRADPGARVIRLGSARAGGAAGEVDAA